MPTVTPRPAATVVVMRERRPGDGFEVLMVRRHDNVAFMGGAYVFPGGRVDDDDRARAEAYPILEPTSRFPDLTSELERIYRAAAVRELEEEVSLQIDPSELVPFAHWVTPDIETKRYDTKFFMVAMPYGQEARHDEHETTDLRWLSPQGAIESCLADEIMLPPPTWTTLKQLAPFSSTVEAFAWAKTKRIVTIQPGFVRDEEKTMLTLPGDPTYPAIDGWEVPEETRFLLQDGRWRPVPA